MSKLHSLEPGTAILCMCKPEGHIILRAQNGDYYMQDYGADFLDAWTYLPDREAQSLISTVLRHTLTDFDAAWAQLVAWQLVKRVNE